MAAGLTKEKLTSSSRPSSRTRCGVDFNFSQNIQDNIEEAISASRERLGQDHRPNLNVLEDLAGRSWCRCPVRVSPISESSTCGSAEPEHQGRSRQAARYASIPATSTPSFSRHGGAVASQVLEGDVRSISRSASRPVRNTVESVATSRWATRRARRERLHSLRELAAITLIRAHLYLS